jgi:Sulfotransferase family
MTEPTEQPVPSDRRADEFLIIGAPRSGTTLLAALIGAHPDVAVVTEDWGTVWRSAAGKALVGNKLCTPIHIELDERWRHRTQVLHRLGLRRRPPASRLSLRDYLVLPARLVTITRERDANVGSMMARGGQSREEAERRWRRSAEIRDQVRAQWPDSVCSVTYEDLTSDPDSVLREVMAFLGVQFDPRQLGGAQYNPNYPDQTEIRSVDADR